MLTADRKAQNKRYYQDHKEQVKVNSARWKAANPDKIRLKNRKLQVKKVYGLSWEDYTSLYNKFSGHCGICGTSLKMVTEKYEQNKAACVDHDHVTGKVRGILCRSCNVALGHFKDSKTHLWNAYKYMEDHGC
jgi:hypothetical protein